MKVVIERSKWLRGEGSTASYLLRKEDQKMCCLGFRCIAGGASPHQIVDRGTPYGTEIDRSQLGWLAGGTGQKSIDISDAMRINDNQVISAAEREAKITEIFARNGDEVEFVD